MFAPPGVWSIPVDIYGCTLTGVGAPAPPANVTLPADGPEGGAAYTWLTTAPWVGFVFWTGTQWRVVLNITPVNPSNPINIPLVWDAVNRVYRGSFSVNAGPGFIWTFAGNVDFTPRTGYARQWMHADCVEEEAPGASQWWWEVADPRLPGSTRWTEHDCGLQWTAGKVRGLVHLASFPHTTPYLLSYVYWEP